MYNMWVWTLLVISLGYQEIGGNPITQITGIAVNGAQQEQKQQHHASIPGTPFKDANNTYEKYDQARNNYTEPENDYFDNSLIQPTSNSDEGAEDSSLFNLHHSPNRFAAAHNKMHGNIIPQFGKGGPSPEDLAEPHQKDFTDNSPSIPVPPVVNQAQQIGPHMNGVPLMGPQTGQQSVPQMGNQMTNPMGPHMGLPGSQMGPQMGSGVQQQMGPQGPQIMPQGPPPGPHGPPMGVKDHQMVPQVGSDMGPPGHLMGPQGHLNGPQTPPQGLQFGGPGPEMGMQESDMGSQEPDIDTQVSVGPSDTPPQELMGPRWPQGSQMGPPGSQIGAQNPPIGPPGSQMGHQLGPQMGHQVGPLMHPMGSQMGSHMVPQGEPHITPGMGPEVGLQETPNMKNFVGPLGISHMEGPHIEFKGGDDMELKMRSQVKSKEEGPHTESKRKKDEGPKMRSQVGSPDVPHRVSRAFARANPEKAPPLSLPAAPAPMAIYGTGIW